VPSNNQILIFPEIPGGGDTHQKAQVQHISMWLW